LVLPFYYLAVIMRKSMKKNVRFTKLIICFIGFSIPLIAQTTFTLKGTIRDADTKDPLIGATVRTSDKGAVADLDGNYALILVQGTYKIEFTYVGYTPIERSIQLNNDLELNIDLTSASIMSKEVTVTADIARDRKTPVAFSNIPTLKLKEELAGQDLPMVLNSTPGAYATTRGGGDGDARVSLRGFTQRNIAVMLDGIPVNDMENGEVFWSNWFGLGLVTKTMQVQRGLGASKLALPSVGGTINILTKGIDSKQEMLAKQEVGNNGYTQTTFGYNSGKLKGGWGISAAGSYKYNNGWVDGTFSDAYFYYLKIEKSFDKHLISLSGFGGPQKHGQRSNSGKTQDYDRAFAAQIGIPVSGADSGKNKGLRYNESWGYADSARTELYNTRMNYYHKPQISLRHSWSPNHLFFLSSVAYLSIGNGGGTNLQGSVGRDSEGLLDIYALKKANQVFAGAGSSALYSSINNHFWYGMLSTAKYEVHKNLALSGGIDLRNYTGEHLRKVYDLLGANYLFARSVAPNDYRNARVDQLATNLYEGDIYNRNYKGFVRWGGLFGLAEYQKDNFTTFLNVSTAQTHYKYEDYLYAKSVDVDGKRFYTSYWSKIPRGGFVTPLEQRVTIYNGTMYVVDHPGAATIAEAERRGLKIDSTTAQNQAIGGIKLPSFTIKAGGAYNLNQNSSVFVNAGYLSKATRFNNVFYSAYNAGVFTLNSAAGSRTYSDLGRVLLTNNYDNEKITAFEAGYSFKSGAFSANVNGYYTLWKNKPVDRIPTERLDPTDPNSELIPLNVAGLGARHTGIEVDFAWIPAKKWKIEGIISLADWIWNTQGTLTKTDGTVKIFDPTGVHVGDAAQQQFGGAIRFEPVKGAYLNLRGTYFGKYYADFQPENLQGSNAGRESWKMPNYFMADLSGGYSFKMNKKYHLAWRFNVLNLLDAVYVADATNNNANYSDFDAKSATVFFGMGRRWNTSLEFSF
jgi:iron complex outermembrane recepter protein